MRFSGPLKRATVSREGDRWFASVMVERDEVKPVAQPIDHVGVDLGGDDAGEALDRPEGRRSEIAQGGA